MAARGNDRVAARNRARERRLGLDVERRRSEERVDEGVTDYELALAARRTALDAVAVAEASMGSAITRVLAEGQSAERAAALCDTTATEVRRLVKLVEPQVKTRPDRPARSGAVSPAA